jgi:hypothetical protein
VREKGRERESEVASNTKDITSKSILHRFFMYIQTQEER